MQGTVMEHYYHMWEAPLPYSMLQNHQQILPGWTENAFAFCFYSFKGFKFIWCWVLLCACCLGQVWAEVRAVGIARRWHADISQSGVLDGHCPCYNLLSGQRLSQSCHASYLFCLDQRYFWNSVTVDVYVTKHAWLCQVWSCSYIFGKEKNTLGSRWIFSLVLKFLLTWLLLKGFTI